MIDCSRLADHCTSLKLDSWDGGREIDGLIDRLKCCDKEDVVDVMLFCGCMICCVCGVCIVSCVMWYVVRSVYLPPFSLSYLLR